MLVSRERIRRGGRNTGFPVLDAAVTEVSFGEAILSALPSILIFAPGGVEFADYWSGCHIPSEVKCGESSGRFPFKGTETE